MIPMKVRKEQMYCGRFSGCDYFLPKVSDSRARIKYDAAVFVCLDLDTGGIAADCGEKIVRKARKE